jgi:hypothetical protein
MVSRRACLEAVFLFASNQRLNCMSKFSTCLLSSGAFYIRLKKKKEERGRVRQGRGKE